MKSLDKIIRLLLMLMLFTSFITYTLNINSSNFIIARSTFSDLFGLLAIGLTSLKFFKKKELLTKIPENYIWALVLVFGLLMSVITSLSPKKTLTEVTIILYLVFLSVTVYMAFRHHLQTLLKTIIVTTFIMAFIGVYDLLAANFSWYSFFPNPSKTQGASGFRYFGQAAIFSFTMLTVLIPLKYSELGEKLEKGWRLFLLVTIVLTIVFLFTTGRVSILISFLIGCFLFLIFTKNKIALKQSLIGFLLFIAVGFVSLSIVPEVLETLKTRVEDRITKRDDTLLASNFIVDNFKGSLKAFNDNKLFGTGLGGYVNNYSKYEIHGTYLKMLGESGLLGVFVYFFFIGNFILWVFKYGKINKHSFLNYFWPFLIASLLAWSYNYHLRKKEFWIVYAVILIIHLDKGFRLNLNDKK